MSTTPERTYPLVDPNDAQRTGAARINQAFAGIDADVASILADLVALQATLAGKAEAVSIEPAINAAIDALASGAPAALDTFAELAAKLADNDDAVAALLASLATKANAANTYSRASVDGLLAAQAAALRRFSAKSYFMGAM